MSLTIKSEQECRWDIASLGEVMLRLDPGEGRIHTTRSFRVCEGGGEYNVAREVDWDALFGRDGVRWFHTGGIYAGLSETTSAVVQEAVQAARRHGTIVSYT
jgi:hypothetical protein|nr:hypothetical protein [Akkermansia muciniphila]